MDSQQIYLYVIQAIGCALFISASLFGFFNMVKFRQHRSYSMALFYIFASTCLVLRAAFYLEQLFTTKLYNSELRITIVADAFSTSIMTSQLLIYLLLIIRLNLYFQERESPQKAQQMKSVVQRNELLTKVVMTFLIFGLPTTVIIEQYLVKTNRNYTDQLIFFDYQVCGVAVTIFIGIILATVQILKSMEQIFGQSQVPERKIIRRTIAILFISLSIRILAFVLLIWIQENIPNQVNFLLATLIFQCLIDLFPCLYLFKIHYNNFMSLEGNEYLETEYADEDQEESTASYNLQSETQNRQSLQNVIAECDLAAHTMSEFRVSDGNLLGQSETQSWTSMEAHDVIRKSSMKKFSKQNFQPKALTIDRNTIRQTNIRRDSLYGMSFEFGIFSMRLIVQEQNIRKQKVQRKRNSTLIQSIVEARRKSDIQEDIQLGITNGGIARFSTVPIFNINEESDEESESSDSTDS